MNKLNEKQLKVYEVIKKFVEICDKHNLKYSAFFGTALGAIRHKGFIPWDDDADFLISKETYEFLKKNYNEYIVDNETQKSPMIFPKFSLENKNSENACFIDLFVTVPTTEKKLKKFNRLTNKIRFAHNFTHRPILKGLWGLKLIKCFLWWTWVTKKITFVDAYNELYEPDSKITHVISFISKKEMKENTYKDIDLLDTIKVDFEDIKINIVKDYEKVFEHNYGKNWRTPIKFRSGEHLGWYDMAKFYRKGKK
ncbi:LicD family protein [Mycoplasmopsis caviae]|uniref:LPS biosynthesis protein n=1 Tax=Mycoplasmopsis caviae TaxID=55603 RepID=A0A3P8KAK2_9BACT|nr:LicD family protein [Mycoplasmopsis caviae]UUD35525.1 LicD family protein [Mycoplasmopsis caviae]VDR41704.1 LPS biosynthesis protein [Mycoplasmopsis caviae]